MKSIEITKEKKSLVVFLLFLTVGFVYIMRPFIVPMVLAAILVTLFYPLHLRFNVKLKKPRLSALATTLVVFFVLIVPSIFLTTVLINQLYGFVETLNFKDLYSNFFATDFYHSYIVPFVSDLESQLKIKINIFGVLTEFGKQAAVYFYNYSPSVLMGTATFVFNFFIMMIGIYFLFIEGPALLKLFLAISPLRETHDIRLFRRVKNTIDASVYGYLVTALVQGLIAAVIFRIVGLDSFVVLGTLTFFMSMVPVLGAAGVWIPVCVWLFLQGETAHGVVVLVCGTFVISGVDNFIKPLIIQGKTKIHPLLIFFSLFGGIAVFGPLGILFGPVITSLLIAAIHIYREEFI